MRIALKVLLIGYLVPGSLIAQYGDEAPGLCLGIGLGDASSLHSRDGVVIRNVLAGGPAAQAGLQSKDILIHVNDKPVDDSSEVIDLIRASSASESFLVDIRRGSERLTKQVTLGRWSSGELKAVPVVFQNGDRVLVDFRAPVRDHQWRPTILADEYNGLADAADSGDASAAYVLGSALENCQEAYTTSEELNQAIDQLYQTLTVPIPGQDIPAEFNIDVDLANVETSLRQAFDMCRDITAEQKAESVSWLVKAAESGHAYAARRLGTRSIAPRAPELDAYKFLMLAWRSGDMAALGALWTYYMKESAAAPERINAIASFNLYITLMEAAKTLGMRFPDQLLNSQRAWFDSESAYLSPYDLDRAIGISEQMLRDNENCCETPFIRPVCLTH